MKEEPLLEILEALDVEVVQRNDNGWLLLRCPFAEWLHNNGRDDNPDAFARIDPGNISGFHCFACKQKGRISSLVRKLYFYRDDPSKAEECRQLAMKADLAETPDEFDSYKSEGAVYADPDPLNKAAFVGMYPLAWEDEYSRRYLQERGISKETAELLSLVYDDDECRILFPVYNHSNDLFGFSGRTILKKHQYPYPKYPKVRDYAGLPKKQLMLGEHLIQKGKPLLIIEGLFAYAHMIEIGARKICNPMAPMGSQISQYQCGIITDYHSPTYLLFDPDEAGEIGLFGHPVPENVKIPQDANGKFRDIVKRLGGGAYDMLRKQVPTFIPSYEEGFEDPDKVTFEMLEEMLRTAD